MKRFFALNITFIFFALLAYNSNAQYRYFIPKTNDGDSVNIPKSIITIHSAVSFGKDYFSGNFFTSAFGVDYAERISPKATIYIGTNIFNINCAAFLEDKSPRRNLTGADIYIGAAYKVSNHLTIAGDIFYNSIFNALGANVDMLYRFGDDSFIEIYASFMRSEKPFSLDERSFFFYDRY